MSSANKDWNKLSLPELKRELLSRKLKTFGPRKELVNSIQKFEATKAALAKAKLEAQRNKNEKEQTLLAGPLAKGYFRHVYCATMGLKTVNIKPFKTEFFCPSLAKWVEKTEEYIIKMDKDGNSAATLMFKTSKEGDKAYVELKKLFANEEIEVYHNCFCDSYSLEGKQYCQFSENSFENAFTFKVEDDLVHRQVILENLPDTVTEESIAEQFPDGFNFILYGKDQSSKGVATFEVKSQVLVDELVKANTNCKIGKNRVDVSKLNSRQNRWKKISNQNSKKGLSSVTDDDDDDNEPVVFKKLNDKERLEQCHLFHKLLMKRESVQDREDLVDMEKFETHRTMTKEWRTVLRTLNFDTDRRFKGKLLPFPEPKHLYSPRVTGLLNGTMKLGGEEENKETKSRTDNSPKKDIRNDRNSKVETKKSVYEAKKRPGSDVTSKGAPLAKKPYQSQSKVDVRPNHGSRNVGRMHGERYAGSNSRNLNMGENDKSRSRNMSENVRNMRGGNDPHRNISANERGMRTNVMNKPRGLMDDFKDNSNVERRGNTIFDSINMGMRNITSDNGNGLNANRDFGSGGIRDLGARNDVNRGFMDRNIAERDLDNFRRDTLESSTRNNDFQASNLANRNISRDVGSMNRMIDDRNTGRGAVEPRRDMAGDHLSRRDLGSSSGVTALLADYPNYGRSRFPDAKPALSDFVDDRGLPQSQKIGLENVIVSLSENLNWLENKNNAELVSRMSSTVGGLGEQLNANPSYGFKDEISGLSMSNFREKQTGILGKPPSLLATPKQPESNYMSLIRDSSSLRGDDRIAAKDNVLSYTSPYGNEGGMSNLRESNRSEFRRSNDDFNSRGIASEQRNEINFGRVDDFTSGNASKFASGRSGVGSIEMRESGDMRRVVSGSSRPLIASQYSGNNLSFGGGMDAKDFNSSSNMSAYSTNVPSLMSSIGGGRTQMSSSQFSQSSRY